MVVRLVIGLAMTALALAVSGRRAWWLYTLIRSGQPAPDRLQQMNERIKAQFVEVFGQPAGRDELLGMRILRELRIGIVGEGHLGCPERVTRS